MFLFEQKQCNIKANFTMSKSSTVIRILAQHFQLMVAVLMSSMLTMQLAFY